MKTRILTMLASCALTISAHAQQKANRDSTNLLTRALNTVQDADSARHLLGNLRGLNKHNFLNRLSDMSKGASGLLNKNRTRQEPQAQPTAPAGRKEETVQ